MADETYVARQDDLADLTAHYDAATAGKASFVRLQSSFGGGKRALVGELTRAIRNGTDDAILWRVPCMEQENGLQWLVRMYGSLIGSLAGDLMLRGKVEMILNAQLPGQPRRVQGWYQEFIAALKEAKPDQATGSIQLKLPRDNPLIGLVEVVAAISRKMTVVLELQNPWSVYSLALAQFLEALGDEAKDGKLLVILQDEPESDATKAMFPMPLLDLYTRRSELFTVMEMKPWTTEDAQKFLDSKGLTGNAARLCEIAGGRPGYIAELVEILEDRLDSDLEGVTLSSLAPVAVNEDELEEPEEAPAEGERKHATAEDAGRIAFFAALLGQAFPSSLVADMGGYDRESIDDLVDALEDLFEEVQFSNELGTWIYKFSRGSWREGILEANRTEEGAELARRVGLFMERFLAPRGIGFMAKTARIYAENGAGNRANVVRAMALSADSPDVWGLAFDLIRYFDETPWPAALRRTVFMNLLDRLVNGGDVKQAERVWDEANTWAAANEDAELSAWLLFNGARLDARRQDFYRARDRARQAIDAYGKLGNPVRQAEIYNQLASIELQDGNPNAAIENADKALQVSATEGEGDKKVVPPGVLANSEQIRGLVTRQQGDAAAAAKHFRNANEIAGQAGIAGLALDSGLSYGEALLASKEVQQARDVLARVVGIARQLNNPVRERSACELLAQAEGSLRNFDVALQHANRTLQLSQQLKFERTLPIDLYNVGFFTLVKNKPSEALTFFRQSEQRIGSVGNHPVVKELFYNMGMAYLQTGDRPKARASLQKSIKPSQQFKDHRKVVGALDALAGIAVQDGNRDAARKLLGDALTVAEKTGQKELRKGIKKKLEQLG